MQADRCCWLRVGLANEKYRANAASDEIREPKEYLVRNRDIVNESQHVWGFPDQDTYVARSGTWSTIKYAKNAKPKKQVLVFLPDGTIVKGKDISTE